MRIEATGIGENPLFALGDALTQILDARRGMRVEGFPEREFFTASFAHRSDGLWGTVVQSHEAHEYGGITLPPIKGITGTGREEHVVPRDPEFKKPWVQAATLITERLTWLAWEDQADRTLVYWSYARDNAQRKPGSIVVVGAIRNQQHQYGENQGV